MAKKMIIRTIQKGPSSSHLYLRCDLGKVLLLKRSYNSTPGFYQKTLKVTQWAVRNFEAWSAWRKSKCTKGESCVPTNLLTCNDAMVLNHWHSLFVIETKRSDGKPFPSKSVDLLLLGLKRYMVMQLNEKDPSKCPVNFLSESDHLFAGLRGMRN